MATRRSTRKRKTHRVSGFQKVWFSKGSEKTAGLIVPAEKLHTMTVSDISRLFPISESLKMARFHTSPVFATWDEAFAFSKG